LVFSSHFEKGKLFMMDWVIVGDCSRWDLGELGLLAGRNGAVFSGHFAAQMRLRGLRLRKMKWYL
jgi:hypothetical protein